MSPNAEKWLLRVAVAWAGSTLAVFFIGICIRPFL
jgi:hypothetical protein